MTLATNWLKRQMANGLAALLIVPLAYAAPAQGQQTNSGAAAQASRQTTSAGGSSAAQHSVPQAQINPPAQSQTAPAQSQSNARGPVGTAAAPYEAPVGAAASRPAGAAIAPAKQKRRRSFLIRMGLVIGAAVAVGTVVALSKASPSRPSH